MYEPVLRGLYALGMFSGPFLPNATLPGHWPFGWEADERPERAPRPAVRRRGIAPACAWGPLPYHPERIRPDLPLSRLERHLARELREGR